MIIIALTIVFLVLLAANMFMYLIQFDDNHCSKDYFTKSRMLPSGAVTSLNNMNADVDINHVENVNSSIDPIKTEKKIKNFAGYLETPTVELAQKDIKTTKGNTEKEKAEKEIDDIIDDMYKDKSIKIDDYGSGMTDIKLRDDFVDRHFVSAKKSALRDKTTQYTALRDGYSSRK